VPVHVGVDAIMSAPEVETAASLHGLVIIPLVDRVGLSLFARATTHEFYSEVYAGPAFSLGNLVLTPSLGIESSNMPVRAAASADWAPRYLHVLAIVEYGGSGLWYHSLANFWLKPVGLGVFAQRYDGFGPWVDVRIQHFDVWTAGLYDYEDDRLGVIAGLELHL
jgi:hypothetical protein